MMLQFFLLYGRSGNAWGCWNTVVQEACWRDVSVQPRVTRQGSTSRAGARRLAGRTPARNAHENSMTAYSIGRMSYPLHRMNNESPGNPASGRLSGTACVPPSTTGESRNGNTVNL